jgi:hypothetical protein
MSDEQEPLLQDSNYPAYGDRSNDPHEQFCMLVGVPSSERGARGPTPRPTSLYQRATKERHRQSITYMISASLSNTLLLTQVVLGATLTALGGELWFLLNFYFYIYIFFPLGELRPGALFVAPTVGG